MGIKTANITDASNICKYKLWAWETSKREAKPVLNRVVVRKNWGQLKEALPILTEASTESMRKPVRIRIQLPELYTPPFFNLFNICLLYTSCSRWKTGCEDPERPRRPTRRSRRYVFRRCPAHSGGKSLLALRGAIVAHTGQLHRVPAGWDRLVSQTLQGWRQRNASLYLFRRGI